ncbi:hypothetical protein ABEB36_008836 [Hypothenemus hampei]|uniref:Protein sleepless n=1 Tax=Hypothenemus hampei TaxID=57062 RepID=A0ABD1EN83_HYPHA
MYKFIFGSVLVLGVSVYEGHALQCWACSSDIDRSCGDRFNVTDFRYGGYYQPYPLGGQAPYDQYNPRPYDRDRDYRNRDPNRDPYFDRDRYRDPAYNRDYNNRDYNNRDPNVRDPYLDHRDQYNRDPNNRDYPPPRDYNQGRTYDQNYPPRDYYQRAQAQISQSGPRLVTCNEDEARLRRMRNVCIKKVQRIGDYQLTYIRRCEMIPYEKEVGTCYDAVARGISLDFCEYCDNDGCNSATGLKFNILLASLVPLALIWAILM